MKQRPYGVLGRSLGHSYTPVIYRELAGLDYRTFEREPEEVASFLAGDSWEGINVTIPYKRDVMPYLDDVSPIARRLGNVNTITRLPDGRLRGDNTDYYGFRVLIQSMEIDLAGKTALVFGGDGGAGSTCCTVLSDLGMEVHPVARAGAVTYDDLGRWGHAAVAVNCTPVGMYPACPASVCSLDALSGLEGLIDIVYNPARTDLMMQAERRGIPCAGGLLMLVAQAARAVELYTGEVISHERMLEVTRHLASAEENIVLIGMPGSGKTQVARSISELTGRPHIDTDHVIAERHAMTCEDFINKHGEAAFREEETRVLQETASKSGTVISCGGGVVERTANYELLHQNSRIVMLDRPLAELSVDGRPLSKREGVEQLAARRMHAYRTWADIVVDAQGTAADTARDVLSKLERAAYPNR
ncbi:shikimate kinase [Collinsella sp. D33t1_170424_A12]|uniref:shikimate kinase n=1 Tax=Collinsella sp. D33t1_170424_A12 TaxID=2787135 RepID=UPI001E4DECE1|nr:shikimate kinase [Collinsella sp. D33t1_170424_A12]